MIERRVDEAHAPDSLPRAEAWQDRAACLGVEGDLFFPMPSDVAGNGAAISVCRRCEVLRPCLAFGLTTLVDGVWGGTTRAQRDALRSEHGIAAEPLTHLSRSEVHGLMTEARAAGASYREIANTYGRDFGTVARFFNRPTTAGGRDDHND